MIQINWEDFNGKIPLIVITGPTASGKTALSVDIARELESEIISADSIQIYKKLNIGSAKPSVGEMGGIVHHLIDFLEPEQNFSVAEYVKLAREKIEEVVGRGKIPIVVGGTGLYISSLCDNVSFDEADVDVFLREELTALANEKGGQYLLEMLSEFDPETASRLFPKDIKRIVRAIEIYKSTSITMSEHIKQSKTADNPYLPFIFIIDYERNILYERINKRVDIMLDNGLIQEVKILLESGITKENTAFAGIGYKEVACYINGDMSIEEMKESIKQGTRRYAKRQLTWFRRDKRVVYLHPDENMKNKVLSVVMNKNILCKK